MSDGDDATETEPVRWERRRTALIVVGVLVAVALVGVLVVRGHFDGRACETGVLMMRKEGFTAQQADAHPSSAYRIATYDEARANGIPEHCARLFYDN